MGVIGIGLAVVGACSWVVGERGMSSLLGAEPAQEMVRRLRWAVYPVFLAVGTYFGARALGYGRVGLAICVSLLLVNATAAAFLRIRWFKTVGGAENVFGRYRLFALTAMAGSYFAFCGAAVYLLRP